MPALLHELIDQAAARHPDRPAVTDGETTLTYSQVMTASQRIAGWLRARDMRRGDRLVVEAAARPLLAALLFAVSRAGVIVVMVHAETRARGLEHILDDCRPALVVGGPPAWAAVAASRRVDTVTLDHLATAAPDPIAQASGRGTDHSAPISVDPVCLTYTSGSTALPKAVVSTHRQMLFAVEAISAELRYQAGDTVFVALPLSFDYGLYQLLLAARAGSLVWLAERRRTGVGLVGALRRAGATVFPAVPELAANLAVLLSRAAGDHGLSLRLLTTTGAAMPGRVLAELRRLLPSARIQVMFGLTECKRVSIMEPDGDLRRPGSSGRPLGGTEVVVVDEEDNELPPGRTGQFVVRGPHVMSGYWRQPALTTERFRRGDDLTPRLYTGDYGWIDHDGYLYVVGRRDDIYKVNGFRVSATEVENCAYAVPGVTGAVLVPPGADRPGAVLFVTGTAQPLEVIESLRRDLEDFRVPHRCVLLPELPLTPNGKVDRDELVAVLREERFSRAAY